MPSGGESRVLADNRSVKGNPPEMANQPVEHRLQITEHHGMRQ